MPVTVLLKVAAPASDISSLNAVMLEEPSSPSNLISPSETELTILILSLTTVILPLSEPSSLNLKIPSPASRRIVPATSKVKSPEF